MPPSRPCTQLVRSSRFVTCTCDSGRCSHEKSGITGVASEGPEVRPDDASGLDRRIGGLAYLLFVVAQLRLGRHVHAAAVRVVTSIRGRRSAGRFPRSARSRSSPGGARNAPPAAPTRPDVSRNATSASFIRRVRMGGQSGFGSSSERRNGTQKRPQQVAHRSPARRCGEQSVVLGAEHGPCLLPPLPAARQRYTNQRGARGRCQAA